MSSAPYDANGNKREFRWQIASILNSPLLATCDLNKLGYDVHMLHDGQVWAERADGDWIPMFYEGNTYKMRVTVDVPIN